MRYLHRAVTLGVYQAHILMHSETCLVGVYFSESAPEADTKNQTGQLAVAHICNPNILGG